ncbi:MAG: DUF4132 domain-containing protein [Chloroflexota bacterium]|nr:DUF4132 domain-containing protein [Chloroflexota bacterium]
MLTRLRHLFDTTSTSPLERALLEIARDVWEVEAGSRGDHYQFFKHPISTADGDREQIEADRERRVAESYQRLLARWPEPTLTGLAAEMYFDSRSWYDRYAWDHRRPEASRWLLPAQEKITTYLLHRWVRLHPPADLAALLRRRIVDHFRRPHAGPPTPGGDRYPYPPTMRDCLELLRDLGGDEADALVYDLVRGELDVTPQPCDHPGCRHGPLTSGYSAFAGELTRAATWMLRRVWMTGRLDEALLEGVFRRQLPVLSVATSGRGDGRATSFHADLGPELGDLVDRLAKQIVRRWADELDATNAGFFSNVGRLEGSWYLTRACQHIEHLGLKRLPLNDYGHRGEVAAAVTRMCAVAPAGDEDEADVVRTLQAFRERTLLLVLPVSLRYQGAICRALGWDGAGDLVRLVQRDVRNSPDPTDGVLDAREVRELRARLGEQRFGAILKAFTDYANSTKNAVSLIQAAVGADCAKILEGFAKRNQIAVKALGLLPLEHPDEALRRYAALREFAKEAAKYGMQRQANERAAAEVALANLALNAGYADLTRLEWVMEDRLGVEFGAAGRAWTVDERYTVRIDVNDGGPGLTAYKDGAPLRSVPAAVRRHSDYAAMKAATAGLRDQARRYRTALERAMCRGDALAADELATLARHPLAARMLAALLFVDRAGVLGLYDPATGELEELGGTRQALAAPARIAHPVDLHAHDLLAPWQREVIRRRIVQPFKQAFRELYLLTPVEMETRVFSHRYGEQVVESARSARLLQSQGWECIGEDHPCKELREAGIAACLTFAESYHYMGEVEALTVDEVCFLPASGPRWWSDRHDPRLPLDAVPARDFSEVMRDVDLVVSVAQYAGEHGGADGGGAVSTLPPPSAEVIAVRAALVRDLAADLGYGNVSVDGHYARVRGKLADYRVHLASATIHVEPGAYLCVVPARWGQRHDKLFLPFEAEDLKTGEVISKVLLLAEDDKIRDSSILGQIRARSGAGPAGAD